MSDLTEQLDYAVSEDGRSIGGARMEIWRAARAAVVDERPGVATNGRAPKLPLAKARYLKNWQKCRHW